MQTLDERAAGAAGAIRASVEDASPVADIARVRRRVAAGNAVNWTFGAAAAVMLFVAMAWARGPAPAPDVADNTPPSVPVTVDDAAPPVTVAPSPDTTVAAAPSVEGSAHPGPPEGTVPSTVVPPADTTPPSLVVSSPTDGDRFDEELVRFSGTTEPGATVRAGRWEADVAEDGSWSIVLVLSPGANAAAFVAADPAGNEATATITVYYDPPAPTTTTPPESTTTTTSAEEPPAYEFTAHQVYGECAEPVPYDVFYGTAFPGEKIRVISDFGSETTYADAEGHWEVRVEFPDAPFGDPFVVRVKDEHGHVAEFSFVRREA